MRPAVLYVQSDGEVSGRVLKATMVEARAVVELEAWKHSTVVAVDLDRLPKCPECGVRLYEGKPLPGGCRVCEGR